MNGVPDAASRLDGAIDRLLRDQVVLEEAGSGSELTSTARLLRDVLPRFHPRFGFEELLAGRLAALRRPSSVAPVRFPGVAASEDETPAGRRRRGLVAGSAIASGVSIAIPLAGAALVVWRRSRSSGGIL